METGKKKKKREKGKEKINSWFSSFQERIIVSLEKPQAHKHGHYPVTVKHDWEYMMCPVGAGATYRNDRGSGNELGI